MQIAGVLLLPCLIEYIYMVLNVAGDVLRFLVCVELTGAAFRFWSTSTCFCVRSFKVPATKSLPAVFSLVVTDFFKD